MVQQGTVYRYPALLAVFFILFRNNRYAPDKQTIMVCSLPPLGGTGAC